MTLTSLYVGDWNNLDIYKLTSLYLYGQTSTPVNYWERLRTASQYNNLFTGGDGEKELQVTIEMDTYMNSGPGRYAYASQASFVQDFFNGSTSLSNGTYTKASLISNYGYTSADFNFSVSQHALDPNSSDYELRTYIYNTSGFTISSDAEFIVNGSSIYVNNMAVHALNDDFDFETSDFKTLLGNFLYLEPYIDPYSIGRQVQINFVNKQNVATTTYTAADYANDVTAANTIQDAYIFPHAYYAMTRVISDLEKSGIIGNSLGEIIYGTNGNDSALAGTIFDDIFIPGEGNDNVTGLAGNDVIYGGIGSDAINGGTGNYIDTVDYSGLDGYITVTFTSANNATVVKSTGGTDYLYDIEVIVGTNESDEFYLSNAGAVEIRGGKGGDIYYGYNGTATSANKPVVIEEVGHSGVDKIFINNYTPSNTTGYQKENSIIVEGSAGTVVIGRGIEAIQHNSPSYDLKEDYLDDDNGDDPATFPGAGPGNPGLDNILQPVNLVPGFQEQAGSNSGGGLDPLVFDLDNSGTIDLVNVDSSDIYFDFWGDGHAERTGWVAATDGMLAIDLDENGVINSAAELFGSDFPLTYILEDHMQDLESEHGFARLAVYDSNSDGKIDSSDDIWSDLKIWQDANQNGISEETELLTLDSLNIASIDVSNYTLDSFVGMMNGGFTNINEGNVITHSGTFTMTDTSTRIVSDVWFETSLEFSGYDESYLIDLDALDLPTLRGYGGFTDLHVAMSQDNGVGGLLDSIDTFASARAMEELFSDYDTVKSEVRSILMDWAGIDENAAPAYENAGVFEEMPEYKFLKILAGQNQEFYGTWFDGTPFMPVVSDGIQAIYESWNLALDYFTTRLVFQSGGADLFESGASYNLYSDDFEGTFALSQTAVDDLETEATSATDKEAFWHNVAQFIDNTGGLDNLSAAEITMLDDAIDTSTSSALGWDDIYSWFESNYSGVNHSGAETRYGTEFDDVIGDISYRMREMTRITAMAGMISFMAVTAMIHFTAGTAMICSKPAVMEMII